MGRLDTYRIEGAGYAKIMSFENWRVAKLCYADCFDPANLEKMERHMCTDEVFLLYDGEAYLITGGSDSSPSDLEVVKMERGVVYNFPKGAWHQILCSRDAVVIIVENEDTSADNSEFAQLDEQQKQYVLSQVHFD